jgi:hypothetical protein
MFVWICGHTYGGDYERIEDSTDMPLLREGVPNSSSCRVLGSGQVRKTRLWLLPDLSDGSDGDDEDGAHLISQLRFLSPTPGTSPTEQCVCAQLFALFTPRRQAQYNNITSWNRPQPISIAD